MSPRFPVSDALFQSWVADLPDATNATPHALIFRPIIDLETGSVLTVEVEASGAAGRYEL